MPRVLRGMLLHEYNTKSYIIDTSPVRVELTWHSPSGAGSSGRSTRKASSGDVLILLRLCSVYHGVGW